MAISPPATTSAPCQRGGVWEPDQRTDVDARSVEGRAERWATWVVIYLAALVSSLAVGASAWALGLVG